VPDRRQTVAAKLIGHNDQDVGLCRFGGADKVREGNQNHPRKKAQKAQNKPMS
jgi:hypothetical protein